MSKLLEIFGKAITVDLADLIWHWLNAVSQHDDAENDVRQTDFNEIVELLGDRNLELAEEKLDFYLFENPDCQKGRMAAVAIQLQKKDMDKVTELLEAVYRQHPSNTIALYTLGYCHERLGHEEQALEFYQDCLKFQRHLRLPRQRLAAIYFKNAHVEKTTQQYEQLICEYPDDISALVVLGHLYLAGGRFSEGIEAFNNSILMHPDNFRAGQQGQ